MDMRIWPNHTNSAQIAKAPTPVRGNIIHVLLVLQLDTSVVVQARPPGLLAAASAGHACTCKKSAVILSSPGLNQCLTEISVADFDALKAFYLLCTLAIFIALQAWLNK